MWNPMFSHLSMYVSKNVSLSTMNNLVKMIKKCVQKIFKVSKIPLGRLHYLVGWCRFQGAFDSREEAIAAAPSNLPVGYDNNVVAEISYKKMCHLMPWDYPVIYWLQRLLPQAEQLLDAGGHMGTKYRAFNKYLDLNKCKWTIYDVPAIVQAGRKLAVKEGLTTLEFVESLTGLKCPDIFLASGLLQYLDIPFSELIKQLPSLPQHLIINKVAMRHEQSVFTLENFGAARVPYQIRNRDIFLNEIKMLGYSIKDEWQIPSLSNSITTHPEYGQFNSAGFYLTLI